MFSWYLLLKFIHIASAIVAVGSNITYGVWNARVAHDPQHLGFTLKGLKFLDDRIANPAYGVLLTTGLFMWFFGGQWPFVTAWILAALVLFTAIGILGFVIFTPVLREQIRLADAGQAASPEFERLSRRSRILGPVLGVLVIVILVLMVFKPSL